MVQEEQVNEFNSAKMMKRRVGRSTVWCRVFLPSQAVTREIVSLMLEKGRCLMSWCCVDNYLIVGRHGVNRKKLRAILKNFITDHEALI